MADESNDPRKILRAADSLKVQRERLMQFISDIEGAIAKQDYRITLGNGWMIATENTFTAMVAVLNKDVAQLTEEINALEARVQVVEA